MYSITGYGEMIGDRVRTDAFADALRQVVKADSVVLDIGTGTGVLALLACKFGARRVYAIEPDDAIQVARQIAVANGYTERIEFIQDLSTQVALPEQADVIVADLGGILPWFRHHIPAIVDARKRFLAPGGVLIPKRDTVWAAATEAPNLYRRLVGPWDENQYGLDMQAARRIVTNTWSKGRVTREQLLVEPQCCAMLDYAIVENRNVRAELSWPVVRAGTGHGLVIWFDSVLIDGVGFSNAPGEPELIYGSVFFPWLTPVRLADEDTVSVTLRADLVGDDHVWSWNTRVLEQGDPSRVKANFEQSTFFGVPLSVAQLRKQQASCVPTLNRDGEIDRLILSSMDGKTPLAEIARKVSDRFPERFTGWKDALTRVGRLSQEYSR